MAIVKIRLVALDILRYDFSNLHLHIPQGASHAVFQEGSGSTCRPLHKAESRPKLAVEHRHACKCSFWIQ